MDKRTKMVLLVVGMAVLFVGAWFAYGALKDEVVLPDALVEVEPTAERAESTDDESEEKEVLPAESFSFVDRDGKTHELSEFSGKPMLLSFWASWCTYCKMQMPAIQTAYEKYGDDIEFLMVNVTDGHQETKEKATALIDEKGYSFPIYFDTEQEGSAAYYVISLPATYMINAEGNIVGYAKSALQEEVLDRALQRTLSGDY